MRLKSQSDKSEFHFEFEAKVGKLMSKFKFRTRKAANLRGIIPPIVRTGDQMVNANLQEPPTSNLPIERTYFIDQNPIILTL